MPAVSCLLLPLLHSEFSLSTAFWQTPDVWKCRDTQCLLLVLSKQGVDCPTGHAFHCNQNFLRMQKEDSGVMRNTNDQRTLFLLTHVTSLYQPTTYAQNDREGKRKLEQPMLLFFFSFSVFSYFSVSQRQKVLVKCACIF